MLAEKTTCNVSHIEPLTDDIFIFSVQKSDGSSFDFKAGQYAMLSLDGSAHEPRPYSIASLPHKTTLDFHIKDNGYGLSHTLACLKKEDTISITIPHGKASYRHNTRPILAIGGGLGLAPLLSITDYALNKDRLVTLMHGAHDLSHLYRHQILKKRSEDLDLFKYLSVCETEAARPNVDFIGLIPDAIEALMSDLDQYDIYLSGAPEMVIKTFEVLQKYGVTRENTFSDILDIMG